MKQKNKPAISVVMSAYNSEKYIGEAIESILNQSFRNFEFIIINDGSIDKTLEIIKRYSKKDNRIRLIDNGKNLGLIKSLNRGLKSAKGKYIARMDADDISLRERFKVQYNYLEENPSIFLIGTGAFIVNEEDKKTGRFNPVVGYKRISKQIVKGNIIYHPTIMLRNGFGVFYRDKMRYCEDYDLYLRLLSSGKKINNLSLPLLRYRKRKDSITSIYNVKQKIITEKAKEFYFQRISKGHDQYDKFNLNKILHHVLGRSNERVVLECEIKSMFHRGNYLLARKLAIKYFKLFGFVNKYLIVYIIATIMSIKSIHFWTSC